MLVFEASTIQIVSSKTAVFFSTVVSCGLDLLTFFLFLFFFNLHLCRSSASTRLQF